MWTCAYVITHVLGHGLIARREKKIVMMVIDIAMAVALLNKTTMHCALITGLFAAVMRYTLSIYLLESCSFIFLLFLYKY